MENAYNEWKTVQQEQIARNQKEIEFLRKEADYYMKKYFELEGEYKKLEVAYIDKLELLQSQREFTSKLITENRYLCKSLDIVNEQLELAGNKEKQKLTNDRQ